MYVKGSSGFGNDSMNGSMKKRLLHEGVSTPLSIATLEKEAKCAHFAPLPLYEGSVNPRCSPDI